MCLPKDNINRQLAMLGVIKIGRQTVTHWFQKGTVNKGQNAHLRGEVQTSPQSRQEISTEISRPLARKSDSDKEPCTPSSESENGFAFLVKR